jgi:2'-5' RNA ligase
VPRLRLAVALLVPEPAATEIDGIRRALGDRGLENVVPHITLIPPVNISVDRIPHALADLRAASADAGPIAVRLGPPETFSPVSPVVYLRVDGDQVEAVHALRDVLLAGEFARPAVHDFVPHVTISEESPQVHIDAALQALHDYAVDVRIDRVHLLRDHAEGPRRWNPIADAMFERPLIVGTGGLPMEISASSLADPQVAPMFGPEPIDMPAGAVPIVVVARRERDILAAGRGWTTAGDPVFVEMVGDRDAERQLLKAATRSSVGRA